MSEDPGWMTIDQLKAWLSEKKCSYCDKTATWLDSVDNPAYCDEHFPYWKEKKDEYDKNKTKNEGLG